MPSKAPLLLIDNVFSRGSHSAILTATSENLPSSTSTAPPPGRLVAFVADYRRDRTFWQAESADPNHAIMSDIGPGDTVAVDSLWLDRGHNLWGQTVHVTSASDSGFTADLTTTSLTVPALGVIGGNPESSVMCVTEESSLYALFAAHPPRQFFRVRVVESTQPIITGIILGARSQLETYSNKLDEDAGGRIARSYESDAGYLAVDRVYAYRTLEIQLSLIGASEYDGRVRPLRRTLFEVNEPVFIVMNYGLKPERGWLYQYTGRSWSAPASGVNRSVTITLREIGHAIR